MTMDNKDIVEKYINGELSGEELTGFEHQLQSNPQLYEEVKLQKEIDHALKEKDVLEIHAQLEGIYTKLKAENKLFDVESKKEKTVRIFNLRQPLAAAAGLAILIGIAAILFFMLRPPQNERLYAQYFKPYDASSVVRSDAKQIHTKFDLAMNEYNSGNYNKAYDLLSEISSKNASDFTTIFFKGISAMELNKIEEAISSFGKIISDSTSIYKETAEWYLGLCLLKKNDKANAIVQFGKITAGEGYYKNDAAKILEKIN